MKKKIVAIFMATILSVSLVACNTGNSDTTADTKKETSVSAKDTKDKKDDTKKEDSKKKESDKEKSDKKKEDDTVKESAKKEEKTDDKKETAKADTGNKDNSTQKPNTNNSVKPENKPSNNNNSNNKPSKPSTPSQPENKPSNPTPTPTPEQPSKPSGGNTNNGNHNGGGSNKPAEKPSEPTPPPHVCSFDTVVSTNSGNCQTASSTVKQCNCGKTTTVTGGFGNHNMVHHPAQGQEVTDYEVHTFCGGCGKDFGSGSEGAQAAGEHIMMDFWDNCENYHSDEVSVGSHWEETSPAYDECSICHKR